MSSYNEEYYPDEDMEYECSNPPIKDSVISFATGEVPAPPPEPRPVKVRTPAEIAKKRAEIKAQGPFFW